MNLDLVKKIKNLTIIALASDDELVESLVLKGGNAIDLAYHDDDISRTSYDLDYSIIDGDFNEEEEMISKRIEKTLKQTFLEQNLVVYDYKFYAKPKKANAQTKDFWGGYKAEFKVIEKSIWDLHPENTKKLRTTSIALNPNNSTIFEIEFSKFEFVGQKAPVELDGYKVYVYTPEMIVFEKVRAICQQLPGYKNIVPSFSPRARARDFYDIYHIMDSHGIEPGTDENIKLIENIFSAKKVPVQFISEIKNNKNIHLDNWKSVKDTVSANKNLDDFNFYFEYVVKNFEGITFP